MQTQFDYIPSILLVLLIIALTESGHRFNISYKYSLRDGCKSYIY